MLRLPIDPTLPNQRRPWVWAGGLALAVALVCHLLQLVTFGPWAVQWQPWTAWPHDFHLWLLESITLAVGVLLLLIDRWRTSIRAALTAAMPLQQWAALVAALAAAQIFLLLGFWWTKDHGVPELGGLRAAFYLGGEWRLPTLFSVVQLWLAAWLAWQCSRRFQQSVWRVAAVICGFMGADELLSIHESIGVLVDVNGLVQTDSSKTLAVLGQRVYLWQLAISPVVVGVGLSLFVGFARATGPVTTSWLVLGASVFLAGAMGFESVQAGMSAANPQWWATEAGMLNLLFEEGLEMLGAGIVAGVFAWHYLHGAPVMSPARVT